MSKIIVTSRYLKCGSKKKLKNYVKYIATREGAVHTVSERENYVGYLANRPNSHGLFSQTDAPINLQKKFPNTRVMSGLTLFLFAGTMLRKWVMII